MHGRFTDAQVQGLTDSVDNAVDKALAFAEGAATAAWNKVSDAVNKALFPGEYRHKERNTKYKAAMNALIKEAQTGTYKPGGLPWGWIAAGLTAAALFMTATGKKSSNGGSA